MKEKIDCNLKNISRWTFFRINKKNKLNENGFVIRVKNKNIEMIAGDARCIDSVCFLNKMGKLETKQNYVSHKISRSSAYSFREDYLNWIITQAYIGGVF